MLVGCRRVENGFLREGEQVLVWSMFSSDGDKIRSKALMVGGFARLIYHS